MNFFNAIFSGFKHYFKFSGRATRSEYWWFYLFSLLGSLCLIFGSFFSPVTFISSIFGSFFSLATFFPHLTVYVRRLHDVGKSGFWILLAPTAIGMIPLIYWMCKKGNSGRNRFGPNLLQKG